MAYLLAKILIIDSSMRNHYLTVERSPANRSISKALYSFSKTKRFFNPNKTSTTDSFYNISSPFGDGKKAGIGYGNKVGMTTSSIDVPSPQNYSIKSLFDGCKKGYIFGIGREKAKNGGVFPTSFTPGPGSYSPSRISKKLKVSFKTKLNPIQGSNEKNPGPGTYNIPQTINAKGKSFLSHIRSCSANSFSSSRSRSTSSKHNSPGPGHYSTKENMNPFGTYYNSKMKNSGVGFFDKFPRKQLSYCATKDVGPGSYHHYTEFGGK